MSTSPGSQVLTGDGPLAAMPERPIHLIIGEVSSGVVVRVEARPVDNPVTVSFSNADLRRRIYVGGMFVDRDARLTTHTHEIAVGGGGSEPISTRFGDRSGGGSAVITIGLPVSFRGQQSRVTLDGAKTFDIVDQTGGPERLLVDDAFLPPDGIGYFEGVELIERVAAKTGASVYAERCVLRGQTTGTFAVELEPGAIAFVGNPVFAPETTHAEFVADSLDQFSFVGMPGETMALLTGGEHGQSDASPVGHDGRHAPSRLALDGMREVLASHSGAKKSSHLISTPEL